MLKYGTDPEFFAAEKINEKYYVVPPVFFRRKLGLKPIIEDEKHPVFYILKNGIKIHEDGAAFEFNGEPHNSIKEVYLDVQEGLETLSSLIEKYGYSLYCKPTINFDTKRFKKETDDFKMCLIFGCDKDYDAWEWEKEYDENLFPEWKYFSENAGQISALKHPFRYAGGHLHISGSEFFEKYPLIIVRLLSMTVGNYVVGNSPFPELEKLRTYKYGKAGKFRPQKYPDGSIGIEYRTPSNTWCSSPQMLDGIEYWINKTLEYIEDRDYTIQLITELREPTINAVLNADQEKCLSILSSLK